MQIHELNNFTGTLGSGAYLAVDDGNDTGKISKTQLFAATEARIDNIIAGPAPSAEEIVDARLGADGVTYPSLGDAIRDQFSDVKADLNLLGKDDITLTGVAFTTEGAINSSGAVKSISGYTTWAYSDYISIPYEAKILETNAVSASASYGLAFYDANKNFIAGSFLGNYSAPTVVIADTYRYVRLTSYNANSTHNINVKFISEKGSTEKSISLACDGNYTYSNINFTTQKGIGSSGLVINATGYTTWACSDFLAVPPHSKVMKTNAISASNTYGLAFYDDTKKYISDSFLGNYNAPTVTVLDTYKYVRITSYKADSDHSTVVVAFENSNSLKRVGIYNETSKNLADVIKNATVLTGTYTLNSVLELGENQSLIGADCVVNVSNGGQIKMVNGSSITGIKFVGSWNPTRVSGDGQTYTEYGYVPLISYDDLSDEDTDALFGENLSYSDAVIYMKANESHNCRVDGCIFENFDRLAIFAGGRRHQEKDNVIVCNCYFSDCRMGVYVHGEFARIYANEYLRCIVGCYLIGGNSNNYGEIFKCCDVAYYMPSNAVAHNEITSVEAAHCGLAGLYIKTLLATLGCQVTGSHFPDAPIVGESVNNLMFVGCRLDTWFKYDSGQHNAIMCSNIGKGYLYGNSLFDVPSDTLITLNRGLGSVSDTDVNWS